MPRKLVLARLVSVLSTIAIPKASAIPVDIFALNVTYCNCLPVGSTLGGTVSLTQGTNGMGFDVELRAPLDLQFTTVFSAFSFASSGVTPMFLIVHTTNFGYSTSEIGAASQDGAGKNLTGLIDWMGGAGGISLTNFETFGGTGGNNKIDFTATVSPTVGTVPEPTSVLLLGIVLAFVRRVLKSRLAG